MNRRYLTSSLLAGVLLCLFMADTAAAQYRADGSWYVRGRVGASSYIGDRDNNPDGDFGEITSNQIGFPSLGLDLGYTGRFGFFNGGLALTYMGAPYETINDPVGPGIDEISEESSQWRHTVGLIGQIGFAAEARVNPYVLLGAGATFGSIGVEGEETSLETAFSPIAGLGVDVALNDRIGLFVEARQLATFPDERIDLSAGVEDDDDDFDLLGFYGVGLRINFESAFTEVEVIAVDGPAELETNESGTFTATVNEEEATVPLEYRWEFGDGNTATGLLASHSFSSEGEYQVVFTASNEGSIARDTVMVSVVPPPVPAEVVTLSANPNPADVDQSVSFSANVRGDQPVECNWDFGDGESSTNCNPSHTYAEEGSYTAMLNVSNEFGEDSRSVTVTVEPEVPAFCMEVSELNSVYFARNSSTLTAEGREALGENLEIVSQCANIDVRAVGYAAPGERNPQELSEARAQAVSQYYQDNGISVDRIMTEGSGQPAGMTSKKGAGEQFRRVDCIPTDAETGEPMGGDMMGDEDMMDEDMDMDDDMDMDM